MGSAFYQELGPTFVKLGQVLSIRPDVLPEKTMKELARLQDARTVVGRKQRSRRGSPTVLGGSWVVISRVISPLIWFITKVTLILPPLIGYHSL